MPLKPGDWIRLTKYPDCIVNVKTVKHISIPRIDLLLEYYVSSDSDVWLDSRPYTPGFESLKEGQFTHLSEDEVAMLSLAGKLGKHI